MSLTVVNLHHLFFALKTKSSQWSLFDAGRSGGIFNGGRSRVWSHINDESWVPAIQVKSRLINGRHFGENQVYSMGLDSIRFETHGMTPTLSLIKMTIDAKPLRRVYSIISNKIEAEIGRFQTIRVRWLTFRSLRRIPCLTLFRFRPSSFRAQI